MLRQGIALAALALALAALGSPALAQITANSMPGLQPGDLLFKGADTATGTRVAARLVWWTSTGGMWIVAADGLSVIHADTGENARSGDPGKVRRVPLSDYMGMYKNCRPLYNFSHWLSAGGVYLAEAAIGLPFDRGFSLETENSLYCSELVWRALSAGAGEDVVPTKSERFGRVYVSMSDLSENALAREAGVVTAAGGEGGDKQTTRAEARYCSVPRLTRLASDPSAACLQGLYARRRFE